MLNLLLEHVVFTTCSQVVIRGAISNSSNTFELLGDVEALNNRFGEEFVKVEPKYEDRLTDYCGKKKHGKVVVCPEGATVSTRRNVGKNLNKYVRFAHS